MLLNARSPETGVSYRIGFWSHQIVLLYMEPKEIRTRGVVLLQPRVIHGTDVHIFVMISPDCTCQFWCVPHPANIVWLGDIRTSLKVDHHRPEPESRIIKAEVRGDRETDRLE